MEFPSVKVFCLLICLCYGCMIKPLVTLPVSLESVGIDPLNDTYIYLGTPGQSIVLDTDNGSYSNYLPSISFVSDFIWGTTGRYLIVSSLQKQSYVIDDIGNGSGVNCVGCFNFTSPQCGLLDETSQNFYIVDQDKVAGKSTIQLYNFTSGVLTPLQYVSSLIWSLCEDPTDPDYYFAMTGREVSKFSYNSNNIVKITSSTVGDELRACKVVGSNLYILDTTKKVIWRLGISSNNIDVYAGTAQGSSICTGDFGGNTIVDFAIWRNQLLVVSREGTLYLVEDTIWQSPINNNSSTNITQPPSDCISYNNSGIISYNGTKTFCENSSINLNSSQVTWENQTVTELGNMDVINLLVNSSEVFIEGNLNLLGYLALQGVTSLQVNGNFTMIESSKLVLEDTSSLFINGCISLNGELTFYQNFSVIKNGYVQMISNYTCYDGQFNNFIVKLIDEQSESCSSYSSELVYSLNSVLVRYHVNNNCNIDTDLVIIRLALLILLPILFTFAVIIGIVYHFYRKSEIKDITGVLRGPPVP